MRYKIIFYIKLKLQRHANDKNNKFCSSFRTIFSSFKKIYIAFIYKNFSFSFRNIPKAKVTRLKINFAAGGAPFLERWPILCICASLFPELILRPFFLILHRHRILLIFMKRCRLALPLKAVTQAVENEQPAAFSSFLPDLKRGMTSRQQCMYGMFAFHEPGADYLHRYLHFYLLLDTSSQD